MKVYWGTRLRGFLKHLNHSSRNIKFIESQNYYETNSLMNSLKSRIIRLRILNLLGIFQVVDVQEKECDCYASFNRFLKTDKPYFIFLENPTALYHYTLGRNKSYLGNKKFKKCLNDPHLKYIVCMSKACEESYERINGQLPSSVKMTTIYPLVPKNESIKVEDIIKKSQRKSVECLYCVQGIRFVSKGGLEVLSTFDNLKAQGMNINLTVITKLSDLDKKILNRLQNNKNIKLYDYTLSYNELVKIYENTNILVQPSSDDSFGLTILEAMKSGCAIIASKLYAFPEMVIDEYNGYLIEPKYWFFDKNNIPNPKVWNHRKKTIYSKKESKILVDSLMEKITKLYDDREKLEEFSTNSLLLANTKFGVDRISNEWEKVLSEITID